jgi:hypothetical protein
MKYFGIIIFLILVVVIISFGITKISQWLGFEKAKEAPKVEAPAKKPVTKPAEIKAPAVTAPIKPPAERVYLPHVSDSQIPYGFKREQLSPYFGKVSISYVGQPGYGRYFSEITMYSSLGREERLNITGWVLKSQKDKLIIPKGVEIYDPSFIQAPQDIRLKSGDSVRIYSNANKIALNFKPNKCTGYLEKIFDFTPDLSLDCPRLPRSEISYLSAGCQDYIMSLGTCQIPNGGIVTADSQCRAVLSTLTYKPCLDRYRNDSYFISSQWWLWVGTTERDLNILNPIHDRLLLLDKNSLLVDEYNY